MELVQQGQKNWKMPIVFTKHLAMKTLADLYEIIFSKEKLSILN
jgi:hypothetical protein